MQGLQSGTPTLILLGHPLREQGDVDPPPVEGHAVLERDHPHLPPGVRGQRRLQRLVHCPGSRQVAPQVLPVLRIIHGDPVETPMLVRQGPDVISLTGNPQTGRYGVQRVVTGLGPGPLPASPRRVRQTRQDKRVDCALGQLRVITALMPGESRDVESQDVVAGLDASGLDL